MAALAPRIDFRCGIAQSDSSQSRGVVPLEAARPEQERLEGRDRASARCLRQRVGLVCCGAVSPDGAKVQVRHPNLRVNPRRIAFDSHHEPDQRNPIGAPSTSATPSGAVTRFVEEHDQALVDRQALVLVGALACQPPQLGPVKSPASAARPLSSNVISTVFVAPTVDRCVSACQVDEALILRADEGA